MKNLLDTLARYEFSEATGADVCNAVIAEIVARPAVATINDARALIRPSRLRLDVMEYLLDLARGSTVIRVCSHCGHPTQPQTTISPDVLAVIVEWERS